MSMPDPPAVMPDEDFIHLRERYHQLPVDLDVRVAWADSPLLGSQHESVMQIRWAIERGDYDNWPALQAMQLLKNRLKPCCLPNSLPFPKDRKNDLTETFV